MCSRTTDEDCTNVSVHGGGEAHSFFLAAVNGFLQRVDHLLVRVDLVIEQHAVVRVSFVPKHKKKPMMMMVTKKLWSQLVCIFSYGGSRPGGSLSAGSQVSMSTAYFRMMEKML